MSKKNSFKRTKINPITNTYEYSGKYDPFYSRTKSTGAQTQNPRLTRAIEDEAFSRNLDVENRKYMKNLKKRLDAVKGRGYKGPLADVAEKYLGPFIDPVGDAVEEGYSKLVSGAKKIGKKIKRKIKGNTTGNFIEVPVKLARTKKTRIY